AALSPRSCSTRTGPEARRSSPPTSSRRRANPPSPPPCGTPHARRATPRSRPAWRRGWKWATSCWKRCCRRRPMASHKITPFLWFDNQAEAAARFYTSVFKNSKLLNVTPMVVNFEIEGQEIIALNGGPRFQFSEAFSLLVNCDNQDEIDYYWSKLTADGGQESMCGWLKDKFGFSWQIVPVQLSKLLGDKDRERAGRAMQAMLKMKKIDIATLERASHGPCLL